MPLRRLFLVLLLALLTAPIETWAAPRDPKDYSTAPRLDLLAVWVRDVDKTAAFLNDVLGWRRHPLQFGVKEDSEVFGGMKLAWVDANGIWLELVQPTTEGPGMKFLREKGDGSVVELDFFVDDFDKSVGLLKAKGIQPMGMDGKPMKEGGLLREWVIVDGKRVEGAERLAYLPVEAARGTSIMLGWEFPSGAVIRRDKTWSEKERTPRSTPRTDYVTVASADLENTAAVYTRVLNLKRLSATVGIRRDWMGVAEDTQAWIKSPSKLWVNLVSPTGKAADRILKDSRLGDGAIVEIAAEVPNIDAFYDAMLGKGIVMTAGDATPLPSGSKAVTSPTGDRYCYFPLDRSEGMRIMIFERSNGPLGALRRRDELAAM